MQLGPEWVRFLNQVLVLNRPYPLPVDRLTSALSIRPPDTTYYSTLHPRYPPSALTTHPLCR